MQPSGHVSIFAHAGLELVGIEMQRGLSAMSSGMKAEKPLKLRASHSAIAFIPPMRNTICIRFPKIFINSSEVCPEVHRLSSWQTAREQGKASNRGELQAQQVSMSAACRVARRISDLPFVHNCRPLVAGRIYQLSLPSAWLK
jgi:hypothetical protein